MSFFNTLDVSATGLSAQQLRMDVLSQNVANINTTRTADGTPYKKKMVMFQEIKNIKTFSEHFENSLKTMQAGKGVRVTRIVEDETEGARVYEPGHPDADEEGYVLMPNVNVVEEMVNMISASRSYESNVSMINTTKAMLAKTMEIGR